ncbi:hypothetical protein [Pseudolysinimonas sp.]|uniref:hypothetical protein n=1 Tax=Pseudolysinimonas sp. TaxID=2680009 RepID=UPI0037835291
MLRIYLDQNKWIDLARAATGHPSGKAFTEALAFARAAIATGSASFPLDFYRYSETTKRADPRSRNDVIDVMLELSRHHTIALARDALPAEIDFELNRRLGRPEVPRRSEVFGLGLRHVLKDRLDLPRPDLSRLDDASKAKILGRELDFERAFQQVVEEELFRRGSDALQAPEFVKTIASIDARYADHETLIRSEIQRRGLTGELLEAAVRASDLGSIQGEVIEALERVGLTWEEFVGELTPSFVQSFMDSLPTRHVTNVMRSAKLRQWEQQWEPNDLNDLLGLPIAAVYCDVVVTERQWAHRLRVGKIDERYGTVVLSNVADLVPILQGASDR